MPHYLTKPTKVGFQHPSLEIRLCPIKGRCIYSTTYIPADTVILLAPVIPLPDAECLGEVLSHYVFAWPSSEEEEYRSARNGDPFTSSAVGLGIASMFNSSPLENVWYEPDYTNMALRFGTLRDIMPQEELLIDYGYDGPRDQFLTTLRVRAIKRLEKH